MQRTAILIGVSMILFSGQVEAICQVKCKGVQYSTNKPNATAAGNFLNFSRLLARGFILLMFKMVTLHPQIAILFSTR